MKIIWPLMLSNAVTAIMQSTDRFFLSQYSSEPEAMSASLPASLLSYTMLCIPQVAIGYTGTFVAQFHGAGRKASCARALTQGVWLTLFSFPVTLLCIPLGYFILAVSGHSGAMLELERAYFIIIMLGGLFLPLVAALAGYLSGLGATRLVMLLTIAGCTLNLLLDYLLIFGKLGFPEMGIRGAALATVIAFFSTMVMMAVVAFKAQVFRGRKGTVTWALDWPLMRKILKYGAPAAFHTALDIFTFTFFVLVVANKAFPQFEIDASSVVLTINHMLFAPLMGIGIGASILVGNFQGMGESHFAYRAGWASMVIGWLYMSLSCVVIIIFAHPLLSLFVYSNEKLSQSDLESYLDLGRNLIFIMTSWGMFDCVNAICGGALKGAGDTKFVMKAGIFSGPLLWLPMIALVWIFARSITNVWLTLPAYLVILSFILMVRWIRGEWKAISLISPAKLNMRTPPAH